MDVLNLSNSEFGRILLMILVLIISLLLGWIVKKVIHDFYLKRKSKHKTDPGKYVLFIFVIRLIILFFGIGYAISIDPNIESATTSFLASAGIATLIVGFAAKDVLSNFVSGVIIIIFRPFTISHWIKVGNTTEGYVEEIKLLYTVIKDIGNRRLIIPNAKILATDVVNSSYHDEDVTQIVQFEISYQSDINKAIEIIQEVAEASPLCMDKRSKAQKENNEPIVKARVFKLGSSSITLAALVWVSSGKNALAMSWCLNQEVWERFKKAGIEIPYNTMIIKNEKQ